MQSGANDGHEEKDESKPYSRGLVSEKTTIEECRDNGKDEEEKEEKECVRSEKKTQPGGGWEKCVFVLR